MTSMSVSNDMQRCPFNASAPQILNADASMEVELQGKERAKKAPQELYFEVWDSSPKDDQVQLLRCTARHLSTISLLNGW